jgi:hypothetical protein
MLPSAFLDGLPKHLVRIIIAVTIWFIVGVLGGGSGIE